mmetsp:Transcript_33625/g.51833  ORF Transcript_33625/g.51833 Transcript_33625/m.51833 type:complete len:256 (+) Transcript_33625:6380-7147(+)
MSGVLSTRCRIYVIEISGFESSRLNDAGENLPDGGLGDLVLVGIQHFDEEATFVADHRVLEHAHGEGDHFFLVFFAGKSILELQLEQPRVEVTLSDVPKGVMAWIQLALDKHEVLTGALVVLRDIHDDVTDCRHVREGRQLNVQVYSLRAEDGAGRGEVHADFGGSEGVELQVCGNHLELVSPGEELALDVVNALDGVRVHEVRNLAVDDQVLLFSQDNLSLLLGQDLALEVVAAVKNRAEGVCFLVPVGSGVLW